MGHSPFLFLPVGWNNMASLLIVNTSLNIIASTWTEPNKTIFAEDSIAWAYSERDNYVHGEYK